MEKIDYIQLFDKFLLKQASTEEIQVLIQWLKSEGSFQDWADEEWNMASSEIDVELQRKLLGEIKLKISDINFFDTDKSDEKDLLYPEQDIVDGLARLQP